MRTTEPNPIQWPNGPFIFVQIQGEPGQPLLPPRSNDPARKWIQDFERDLKTAFDAAEIPVLMLAFVGRPHDATGAIMIVRDDVDRLLFVLKQKLGDYGLAAQATIHWFGGDETLHAETIGKHFDTNTPFTVKQAQIRLFELLLECFQESFQRPNEIIDRLKPAPPPPPPPSDQKPNLGNSGGDNGHTQAPAP